MACVTWSEIYNFALCLFVGYPMTIELGNVKTYGSGVSATYGPEYLKGREVRVYLKFC